MSVKVDRNELQKAIRILQASDKEFEENGWDDYSMECALTMAIKGLIAWKCTFDFAEQLFEDMGINRIHIDDIASIYNSLVCDESNGESDDSDI